jgi:hypothetical protein
MDWNELLVEPRNLGVPLGASKTISKPMLHLALTVHISWIRTNQNELPLEPRDLGVPSDASKMISKPMVHLAQTVYLSCTDTNTISKQTERRFHRTHIIEEFHRPCPKRFLSLWYFRRKPCTYLASKLALSPNRPKQASSKASSHRSTFGCVRNDF